MRPGRELAGQGQGDGPRPGVRLEMSRQDEQASSGAVRLEVDTRHQAVAEQERQDVVTPSAFRPRDVDLKPVFEVEEPRDPRSVPDQRVEGREQARRVDLARQSCPGVPVGRFPPPLDAHPAQVAGLNQLVEPRAGLADRHAIVVGQVVGRADAEGDCAASRKSSRCASSRETARP